MASNYNFYDNELEVELERIKTKCDYYQKRMKEISTEIREKTIWVNLPVQQFQIDNLINSFNEYCAAMSQTLIESVSPVAYKHRAEKKDLINYTKAQYKEYSSNYRAYCLEIVPKKQFPRMQDFLNKTLKEAVYVPWGKTNRKNWKNKFYIMLWSVPSALGVWSLDKYGLTIWANIKMLIRI